MSVAKKEPKISAKELDSQQWIETADQYLDSIFNRYSGFINYEELGINKKDFEKEKIYLTYGEIKVPSLNDLVKICDLTESDVFYDMGSGIGKVNCHFFLKSPIRASYGVEFNKERSDDARKIKAEIERELPEAFLGGRQLEFYQDNMLTIDISESTVIMLCSTCYGEDLMQGLSDQINKNCPKIRHVFSLKQIPNFNIPLREAFLVDCSWGKTKSKLYWYSTETGKSVKDLLGWETDEG